MILPSFRLKNCCLARRRSPTWINAKHPYSFSVDFLTECISNGLECVLRRRKLPGIRLCDESHSGIDEDNLPATQSDERKQSLGQKQRRAYIGVVLGIKIPNRRDRELAHK